MNRMLCVIVGLGLASTSAHAQGYNRTYAASSGSDNTTCGPRNAPCKTLNFAIAHTLAGGEANCLDVGATSGINIERTMTVDCSDTLDLLANGPSESSTILINAAATDRVTVRGFRLHPTINSSAITVNSVGTLILDNMRIVGAANSSASGIDFSPSNAGAKLVVTDTVITTAGNNLGGAGIRVIPDAGATAQVSLNRVSISASAFGLALDGTGSTGGINATVIDSFFSSNINDGIVATTPAGGAPIGLLVSRSTSTNNGYGVRAIGSNVTVRIKGSEIAGNGTGLQALSGGALLSGGENTVQANGANGGFSGSYATQ